MDAVIFTDQTFEILQTHSNEKYDFVYYTKKSPTKDTPNEDSIGYILVDEHRLIFMLSDGAGGHPKGEKASRLVLDAIKEKISMRTNSNNLETLRNFILDGLEWANEQLLVEGSGSKATATICELLDRDIRSYQVGDSGLIVCGQKGKLKYKTIFHSPVGYGIESGLLEEEKTFEQPNLNEVTNIVGSQDMTIELGPKVSLDDKDTIFIASDGVFDNFSIEELINLVRKGALEEAGNEIMGFFEERIKVDPEGEKTKYDDLSFIICRLRDDKL